VNQYKDKDLRKFIESIPSDEVEQLSRIQREENEKAHKEFIDALNNNECFICGRKINTFEERNPCFHWFTYPKGIKKRHFNNYLRRPLGYFRLECYFRWLANTEIPIGQINDLKDETSKTSYLETTIKYKNIEWAFSIGYTDKEGHFGKRFGEVPHYHIQMKVDGRMFISFGDFHIRFTDEDLFALEMIEQAGDMVKIEHSFGNGIGIIEHDENHELIANLMTIAENESTATFNIQTLIEAPEGETISGELIVKAIEESKKTKRPIGNILEKYLKDAKVTKIIVPGEGVPKMAKRSGKKLE
jgi:hypothetical protein